MEKKIVKYFFSFGVWVEYWPFSALRRRSSLTCKMFVCLCSSCFGPVNSILRRCVWRAAPRFRLWVRCLVLFPLDSLISLALLLASARESVLHWVFHAARCDDRASLSLACGSSPSLAAVWSFIKRSSVVLVRGWVISGGRGAHQGLRQQSPGWARQPDRRSLLFGSCKDVFLRRLSARVAGSYN